MAPVQRSDLAALRNEIDQLWREVRQLREKIATTWNLSRQAPLILICSTDNLSIVDADEDGGDATQFGNSTLPINGWIKVKLGDVVHYIPTTETEP